MNKFFVNKFETEKFLEREIPNDHRTLKETEIVVKIFPTKKILGPGGFNREHYRTPKEEKELM